MNMETLAVLLALLALILTSGIFLIAFKTFLLKGVNVMLNEKTESYKQMLQEHSHSMHSEMDNIRSEMGAMKVEIKNNKAYMEKRLNQLSKTDNTILKLVEDSIANTSRLIALQDKKIR